MFTQVSLQELIVVAYGFEGVVSRSVEVKDGWWANPAELFDVQGKADDPSIATEAQYRSSTGHVSNNTDIECHGAACLWRILQFA